MDTRIKTPDGIERLTVFKAIPEPVSLKMGPAPAEPPFRVRFVAFSKKPLSQEPLPNRSSEALRKHNLRARDLCELHLGKARWVLPDGRISDGKMPREMFDGIRKLLFRTERPVVELLIDFDIFENELYGNKLPDKLGPIKEIRTGFSCDVWRLFLTRRDNLDWHDLILFKDGSFYLHSVSRP